MSYNHTGLSANSNGLQAFANYNATAGSALNINTAGATDTTLVTSSTTTPNITASKTINALKISGTGLSVGGAAMTTLTLTAAGVAVTGGNDTINVPILAFGANQAIIHVNSGAQLNLNSMVTGTGGFVKADDGLLVLNAPANAQGIANTTANIGLTGTHNVLGGTLKLGTNNAIFQNSQLRIGAGGTLDLNGKTQFVQSSSPTPPCRRLPLARSAR